LPLWYAAGRIILNRGNDVAQSHATGFFWSGDDGLYLITNWHNVTGWNPVADTALSATGFRPTHVSVPVLYAEGDGKMLRRQRYNLDLYDDQGEPLWLEHPVHGRQVDVVALRLSDVELPTSLPLLNEFDGFFEFDVSIGDDAFVLGYPYALSGGNDLAIWKRASIATLPNLDIDGLPKILIDTATRKGMSGSPVIARRKGFVAPKGASAASGLTGKELFSGADTFFGVYSGRVGPDELGGQLGIVWRADVVDQIISGKRRGDDPTSSVRN